MNKIYGANKILNLNFELIKNTVKSSLIFPHIINLYPMFSYIPKCIYTTSSQNENILHRPSVITDKYRTIKSNRYILKHTTGKKTLEYFKKLLSENTFEVIVILVSNWEFFWDDFREFRYFDFVCLDDARIEKKYIVDRYNVNEVINLHYKDRNNCSADINKSNNINNRNVDNEIYDKNTSNYVYDHNIKKYIYRKTDNKEIKNISSDEINNDKDDILETLTNRPARKIDYINSSKRSLINNSGDKELNLMGDYGFKYRKKSISGIKEKEEKCMKSTFSEKYLLRKKKYYRMEKQLRKKYGVEAPITEIKKGYQLSFYPDLFASIKGSLEDPRNYLADDNNEAVTVYQKIKKLDKDEEFGGVNDIKEDDSITKSLVVFGILKEKNGKLQLNEF